MSELDRLREVAEAATPGPWRAAEQMHGQWTGIQDAYSALGSMSIGQDARHIATFDPPTVLALLDRLEAAEAGNRGLIATCEAAGAKIQALEAKVARAEVLADEWETIGSVDVAREWDELAADLRAALSDPQPADGPGGHGDAAGPGETP